MKKRMISFLLTVTMAVVLLAGCQSGGAPEQAVPERAARGGEGFRGHRHGAYFGAGGGI